MALNLHNIGQYLDVIFFSDEFPLLYAVTCIMEFFFFSVSGFKSDSCDLCVADCQPLTMMSLG